MPPAFAGCAAGLPQTAGALRIAPGAGPPAPGRDVPAISDTCFATFAPQPRGAELRLRPTAAGGWPTLRNASLAIRRAREIGKYDCPISAKMTEKQQPHKRHDGAEAVILAKNCAGPAFRARTVRGGCFLRNGISGGLAGGGLCARDRPFSLAPSVPPLPHWRAYLIGNRAAPPGHAFRVDAREGD